MRISETYSHINGLEYLLVQKPEIWLELQEVIGSVSAEAYRIQISTEAAAPCKVNYDAKQLHERFRTLLKTAGWKEAESDFWITQNEKLARATLPLAAEGQRRIIEVNGEVPIKGHHRIDTIKDRVAVEVQFGKYAFVAYDLFVKHLAFFVSDQIDVGIEILPMKSLQSQMSSGVPYFEGEFYNVIRQGRGVPAVPLVIVGIEP
ncbi:MAG: BglII/BstYI family type II restriction endonuclease [Anaerolineae bacterium]|jgi:hypothetical protein